jgi:hypothetical protein
MPLAEIWAKQSGSHRRTGAPEDYLVATTGRVSLKGRLPARTLRALFRLEFVRQDPEEPRVPDPDFP